MKPKISIVGAGMGSPKELTRRAFDTVKTAEKVFAFTRISENLKELRYDIEAYSYSDIVQHIRLCSNSSIAVLVSGDTGFFSAAQYFINELGATHDIELIAGINSMQYLCAQQGVSYENIKIVSLHGRSVNFLGAVSYNKHTFILTGGKNKADFVCAKLVAAGLGGIQVVAGEDMSLPSQRILSGTAADLAKESFSDLAVLLVENNEFKNRHSNLSDNDFIRGEGTPMTKEEVRWITLAKLNVKPTDIVYDIGAGTGSVAVQLAHSAFDGTVYAIERDDDAYKLLLANRARFGAYNMTPVFGEAPFAISPLPAPDKAFIGGSGGNIEQMIDFIYKKNSNAVIVINAVTLDTLNESVAISKKYGKDTDVVCVNISKSKNIGGYKMMCAANPVYIITVLP